MQVETQNAIHAKCSSAILICSIQSERTKKREIPVYGASVSTEIVCFCKHMKINRR